MSDFAKLKIDTNKNIYNFEGPTYWEGNLVCDDFDNDGMLDLARFSHVPDRSVDFVLGNRQKNNTIKFDLQKAFGEVENGIVPPGFLPQDRARNNLLYAMEIFSASNKKYESEKYSFVQVRIYPTSAKGLKKVYFETKEGKGQAIYGGVISLNKNPEKQELPSKADVAGDLELAKRIQTLYDNAVNRDKIVEGVWHDAFDMLKSRVKGLPAPKNQYKLSYVETQKGCYEVYINGALMYTYDLTLVKIPSVNDIPSVGKLLWQMAATYDDVTDMFDFR